MAASSVEISSSSSPLSDDDKGGLYNDVTVPISKKSGDVIVPREGMQFASLQEFESFYYNFALSEGFSVRIKRTNKFPRSDKIRYRQYVCSCAGFCEEKKSNDETDMDQEKTGGRITHRTGCRVTISVSNKKSIWKVGRINKEHNHPLAGPSNPCRKDLRRKNLDRGGASAVLQYCVTKKAQDPNFFYAIQTDEEDRLANFFWIDSTARQYYERFGDVLIFDTTYRTNKNGLSLGNFVGVNNNIQSIMFGFALLRNEQEETFVWLFENWLHAVGGKLPVSILTDQNGKIQNAIAKVFPTVSHRFSLWHIMKKFPKYFGSLYKDNSPFYQDLKNCLYNSITTEQFDNEWKNIMKAYKLMKDERLNKLFDIRQSWVPLYNRTIFYADMDTTQGCESIHSFFDSFFKKGTTLQEFVIKYELAIEQRYRVEYEQFDTVYKNLILKLKSPLEEQAADVYTPNIFNQFQDELMESLKLRKEKLEKSGSISKYKVSNFHDHNEAFVVILNVESWEISCECHLFEFKGILCRHILAVFSKKDVASIPPKYLLPRWAKKATKGIHISFLKKDGDKFSMVHEKFDSMVSQLRPYLHVSTNSFDFIMEALDGVLQRVSNLEENQEGNKGATVTIGFVENSVEHLSIANPPITKTMDRKEEDVGESKRGCFKSSFEVCMKNSKKLKRQCKNCGQCGHYSSTCEQRKRADVMEDAPTLD